MLMEVFMLTFHYQWMSYTSVNREKCQFTSWILGLLTQVQANINLILAGGMRKKFNLISSLQYWWKRGANCVWATAVLLHSLGSSHPIRGPPALIDAECPAVDSIERGSPPLLHSSIRESDSDRQTSSVGDARPPHTHTHTHTHTHRDTRRGVSYQAQLTVWLTTDVLTTWHVRRAPREAGPILR